MPSSRAARLAEPAPSPASRRLDEVFSEAGAPLGRRKLYRPVNALSATGSGAAEATIRGRLRRGLSAVEGGEYPESLWLIHGFFRDIHLASDLKALLGKAQLLYNTNRADSIGGGCNVRYSRG